MKKGFVIFLILLNFGAHKAPGQGRELEEKYLDSLLSEFRVNNDSASIQIAHDIVSILGSKGWDSTNSGQFSSSYNIYRKAFEFWESEEVASLFKKFPEDPGVERLYWHILTNLYFNYGHLMGATGNAQDRKLNYLKSYELAKERDDVLNIVYSLSGLTLIHLENGELDSARILMDEALTYPSEKVGFNYSTVLYLDGMVKYESKQYEAARQAFSNGLADGTKRNNTITKAFNTFALSKTYFHLNEPDSTYHYARKSLEIMKDLQEIQVFGIDISDLYEHFYDHFQKEGRPDSAQFYLQLSLDKRTDLNKKKMAQMAAFQQELLKREQDSSRQEKARVERESQFRTYSFLSILAVFSALGLILYRSYRQKQKANIQLSSQKEEIQKTLSRLKETQAQLIQSEKMASLGELTAGIAHEIQNPLNFVNNFSEVSNELIDEMKDEFKKGDSEEGFAIADDIKQNLEKIAHHGKRADAIVKGMLQHSRTSSAEKEPTDINKLADEYLRLAYHGLRAKDKTFNATLETDFDDAIGLVDIIPQDIGRVILNLITNAFYAANAKKHSLEYDSSAIASAKADKYQPTVTVSTKKLSDTIVISVKDNGHGIPQHLVGKIFQPFFTTKPTGEGTGLGLSMSYDIVKAHGGELSVSSNMNEGSTFIIQLTKSDL